MATIHLKDECRFGSKIRFVAYPYPDTRFGGKHPDIIWLREVCERARSSDDVGREAGRVSLPNNPGEGTGESNG